jgi:two-component system sensor histidine kinase RegB
MKSAGTGRVRLRTLVLIRWVAVAGQSVALIVVFYGLGFPLPIVPALALVAVSALFNVAMSSRGSASTQLSDRGAACHLAYDILQFTGLLFLTGGLHNPFSLLFLAPMTISATVLSLRSTLWLGLLAVACVSLLAHFYLPLPWREGGHPLSPLYIAGIWFALVIGMTFISAYAWRLVAEAQRMSDALVATRMALAYEQRRSALHALAAATAHELGTPLGTIAVVAKELSREVPEDSPLAEDVALLSSQAARCREILARLGHRPDDEGDNAFAILPLAALVATAAAPYRRKGIDLEIVSKDDTAAGGGRDRQPMVKRTPEIIHGLGNLIENAVDFARSAVRLEIAWNAREIRVEVLDDGPGMPTAILGTLGEPYITTRAKSGGMGLGVFIAKTLLERTGADLRFVNRPGGGVKVAIIWPHGILEPSDETPQEASENRDPPTA